jgi:hypothetical protein
MASTPSLPGVPFPLTVTQNENAGEPAVLFSGTGWVPGYPRGGPPPHPGPAVHRYGYTALHWAAVHGNRRIVRLLVDANADVNAQSDHGGCAVSACGESAVSAAAESPPPSAVQGHAAARCRVLWQNRRHRRAAAARRRRGRPGRQRVPLRCAAQPNRNRNSRARAGARRSNTRKSVGSSRGTRRGRARFTPPAASQPPPTPRPIPGRAAGADGCAVGARRRRSPIQRAGRHDAALAL